MTRFTAEHRFRRGLHRPTRLGFTIIEALVVVGVIGILLGLLLPAVQAAREAARRAKCVANLRQIAVAMHNYESNHLMFPPGQLETGPHYTANHMSGLAFLLPYMEQQALYSSINTDFVHLESGQSPRVENRTARNTRLTAFLCPSDTEPEHLNSYRFNRGRFGLSEGRPFDGPFSLGVLPRVSSITDGLARTAFLSERIGGSFRSGDADRRRDIKLMQRSATYSTDDELISLCVPEPELEWFFESGRYWLFNGTYYSDYNHNGLPNDARPSCSGFIDLGLHPPRSYHPAIVNVLFGDGHVDTASDTISRQVWIALGTHDSGD